MIDETPKQAKIIAISLIATGIFAAVGSLYTWGNGLLFFTPTDVDLGIFIADLIVAAPVSLIAGIGFWNLRRWGLFMSLFAVGVYIYGSVQVYVFVLQTSSYSLTYIIPPIFGIGLSTGLIIWTWKNFEIFEIEKQEKIISGTNPKLDRNLLQKGSIIVKTE